MAGAEASIKIEGVHPNIDGEYPIDPTALTNRDYNDIKRVAKLRSREIQEAFESGDTDLFVAFAVIALRHAGKTFEEAELWDAPLGKILFVAGDEEAVDDLPPVSAPPSATQKSLGGDAGQSEPRQPSGLPLSDGVESPGSDRSPTGAPLSGTGAMSLSTTSAT